MKFLVFQHIACEHPGIFRDLMKESNVEWDAIELDEGELIPDFEGYDALLVMGGPMDVWQTATHPWLEIEVDAIKRWVESGKPYLGFCLGHQLLAQALGGAVGPAESPEIGILPVTLSEEGNAHWFFRGCNPTMKTLQWHSAEVTALPSDAKILAQSDACRVNAMSWGEMAVSVQFHVELTDSTVSDWGKVPAYEKALNNALGHGALIEMNNQAQKNMGEFNFVSRQLYRNFIDRIQLKV